MKQEITIESIQQEKAELQKQINEVSERLAASTNNLMTEPTPLSQRERIMNTISKGMAIADGAILGYRLLRHVRGFFLRGKGKKK